MHRRSLAGTWDIGPTSVQTFAMARKQLRGGRGGRRKGEKHFRMFANEQLLAIFECADIDQLRETSVGIKF
jgi:hypothetical protein